MSLIHPIDHGGYRLLEGYQGETTTSGSDDGKPWTTTFVRSIPISGSTNNELYVYAPIHSGSLTGSSGFVIWASGADGTMHPVGCRISEDGSGQYALKTDTELILSGNIVVTNVRVFSTDGTSGSLVYARAQATTDYPFGIPVSVSGAFLEITNVNAGLGAAYTTSSIAYPVYVNLYSGSIGAHIDGFGALFVTSSEANSVYSSLVALSGSTLYTASIDAYNDLHTYDWRVSSSLSQSNDLLTQISGAIVADTVAVYAVSSSVVALNPFLVDISGSEIQVSGSVVGTYQYLTNISGSVTNNSALVSSSIVADTVAVYAASSSIDNLDAYLTRISSSIVNDTVAAYAISSSIVALNPFLVDVSGSVTNNSALISSSIVNDTTAVYAVSSSIAATYQYLTNISGSVTNNSALISSSIVNEFATSRRGSEALYVTSSFTSPVYEVPVYTRASMSIDETNANVGTTSSDYSIYEYKYFCLQFSNMLNCTASISGTLDPAGSDWIPITVDISGYQTITGSCIICQSDPVKWEKVRVNYSKSINTNSIKTRVSIYN